jgi:4-amino-4-deoxy-L-arabinose transferase-like glycosyltransferase
MLLVSLRYHVIGDYNVETDFYWSYVPQARHILEGKIPIEDFHGPVYPLVLAFVALISNDLFHAGVVLSVLAASASLYLVFEILRRLFRGDVALLGTLLVAANTTFVRYTYTAGTDMLFMALITASTYFFLREGKLNWRWIALSAVAAALGYLTRYNGLSAAVGVPAAILLANPFQLSWRDRLKASGMFLGFFLLAIAPWGIYCLVEKGSFFYNRNYLNIAYEMFAKGKIGWDQYWYGEAQKFSSLTQVVFSDPPLFFKTLIRNLIEHGTSDMQLLLGWQVGVFSLFGIAACFKYRPSALVLSYFIIGAAFFLVLLLVFYGERFSMLLLPIYAALALKTLALPGFAKHRFWKVVHSGGVIAVVLIVWTAYSSIEFNRVNIDSGPQEVVGIAKWFHQNYGESEKGKIVITRKPHVAYYLGMTMEMFPYVATYEELLAHIRIVKASYLYFGLMEAGMRPQFQRLLDPRTPPKELKPLTYTTNPPAVLYKIDLEAVR